MWYFNLALTRLFDALAWPFQRWPAGGLLLISALTGVAMLLIFKATSNQRAIRRTRDLIRAHLLAMRLFRDDARVVVESQKKVLRTNLTYLRYAVVPIVFILPIVVLIMVQLDLRYGPAPAQPGEAVVVKAIFDGAVDDDVTLAAPPGIVVETPALRIPYKREADWRVRPAKAGRFELSLKSKGATYGKELVAGEAGVGRVSSRRVSGIWSQLMTPGERPLSGDLKAIEVKYPSRQNKLFGLGVHWMITFFVVSLVAAFALKGVLKTEV
ncbi:MAG: hypothetical protein V3W11_09905 [bacterium]